MDSHVHASGHGSKEELRWIHQQIPHKFFIPLHGEHHMLYNHKQLALEEGMPESNVMIPDNGAVFEIYAEGTKMRRLDARAPHAVVTVDGFSVGELQEVVMRDRNHLEENGIFVVVASINTRTKKLRKSPDISLVVLSIFVNRKTLFTKVVTKFDRLSKVRQKTCRRSTSTNSKMLLLTK